MRLLRQWAAGTTDGEMLGRRAGNWAFEAWANDVDAGPGTLPWRDRWRIRQAAGGGCACPATSAEQTAVQRCSEAGEAASDTGAFLVKLVVNGSEGPRRALPDSALPLLRSSRGPTSQPPPRPHHHAPHLTHRTTHGYRHTGTGTFTDPRTHRHTHRHTDTDLHGDSHPRTRCPGGLSLSRRPAVLICCVLGFETATGSRRLPAAPLAYTRRQPRCLALCATRPTAPTAIYLPATPSLPPLDLTATVGMASATTHQDAILARPRPVTGRCTCPNDS
jgi:hypothetical protein